MRLPVPFRRPSDDGWGSASATARPHGRRSAVALAATLVAVASAGVIGVRDLRGVGTSGSTAGPVAPSTSAGVAPLTPVASPTAPLAPRIPTDPALAPLATRVSSTHLVDAAGATLALRGVNLSGTEFACDQGGTPTARGWSIYGYQPLDQASTYTAMQAWHIGVVRVPLNEDCWLGINGVAPALGGARYVAAIQREVSLIHAAGMRAILDLHWTSPGAWAAIAQQPLPDAEHSIAFWSSVATTFGGDPAVIFDLFNEPFLYTSYQTDTNVSTWDCWLKGCTLNKFVSASQIGPDGIKTGYNTTLNWRTAGMQQLVDAIRATGAGQPILVNGLDWSNDVSGWSSHRPHDPLGQIAAGWHSYPTESCNTSGCWDAVVAGVARTAPVIIGEMGDQVCGGATYADSLMSWADAHDVSYLGWTWNPWADCSNVLIKAWTGTPTRNFGVAFRAHLVGLP